MSPMLNIQSIAPLSAADVAAANETYVDFHVSASTSNDKVNIADLEARWKDLPDKYFIAIAHFLAGTINDTAYIDSFNGPILKNSIKSVYWIFLIQYALLAMLGVVMNLAIIVYIMFHHLYKDVTHAFIINLALCHFVQCAIVLPITLMVMLIQNWIFGQFMCFFLPMLQDIPLHVAMISHILIAWDRMRWLGDPLKGRLPAFVCCCATWLTGMVIALPYPIYTIYVEIGDYLPRLNGIGLCVVNLMDDMHEYMRGLFLIMYCGPTVLLAYLYIRTSQELRPPDGPFAVMMFEHRSEMRNRQRNSSASSVERAYNNTSIATTGLGSQVTTTTTAASTNTNGHATSTATAMTTYPSATATATGPTTTAIKASLSYDLYSAELDVYREKRKQRNFGSMATAQVVCLCPLMVLRLARLSMEETYENSKHFDFTYLMFVWIAFLPTVIFPCIYASQILPRTEQKRLRGYFRLSTKRLHKTHSGGCDGSNNNNGQSSSSRENSIEKDDNTNTTQATSVVAAGDDGGNGNVGNDDALTVRHELRASGKHQFHYNNNKHGHSLPNRQGKHKTLSKVGSVAKFPNKKNGLVKRNDVKINVISDERSKTTRQPKSSMKTSRNASITGSIGGSATASITGIGTLSGHRNGTLESLDNNSCSNVTSSTYCNGNSSRLDDCGMSNFGDGEDSSIVSGMIVQGGSGSMVATPFYDKKWGLTEPSMRNNDMSFSDCSSFGRVDSSSTLERDLEIIDLLERERSMDIQEMIEREKHGESIRLSGERRRLPDIEKIYQRSPKLKIDPYNFDMSQTSSSTISGNDNQTISTLVLSGSDPLQASNENYSNATTLNNDEAMLPQDRAAIVVDEEVPQDFFDNFPPGGAINIPVSASPISPAVYQYQYTRRPSSRKALHHSQSSASHRTSKRDSFNSLNGSDLIAGAFGELDPTQPLNKMAASENRMRRNSGRNSSFSSSARSSLKSRDFNHSSSHSPHPELDFRENIFAEL